MLSQEDQTVISEWYQTGSDLQQLPSHLHKYVNISIPTKQYLSHDEYDRISKITSELDILKSQNDRSDYNKKLNKLVVNHITQQRKSGGLIVENNKVVRTNRYCECGVKDVDEMCDKLHKVDKTHDIASE